MHAHVVALTHYQLKGNVNFFSLILIYIYIVFSNYNSTSSLLLLLLLITLTLVAIGVEDIENDVLSIAVLRLCTCSPTV